jgi:hypothetical protein
MSFSSMTIGQLNAIESQLVASGYPASAVSSILQAIDSAGFDLTERSTSTASKTTTDVEPEYSAVAGRPGLYAGVITVSSVTMAWMEQRRADGSVVFVPIVKVT